MKHAKNLIGFIYFIFIWLLCAVFIFWLTEEKGVYHQLSEPATGVPLQSQQNTYKLEDLRPGFMERTKPLLGYVPTYLESAKKIVSKFSLPHYIYTTVLAIYAFLTTITTFIEFILAIANFTDFLEKRKPKKKRIRS
jgi:hypothetical protein